VSDLPGSIVAGPTVVHSLGAAPANATPYPSNLEAKDVVKFAIVSGTRAEAQPDLSGQCPCCNAPTVARCGEVRAWHWAHRGRRSCDPWWEGETEWHRNWKNEFPLTWQEVVHHASDGERHIADVKTPDGWVFEFQHSYLKPEERRSREAFYQSIIWVVDGLRRDRDASQLLRSVARGKSHLPYGTARRIADPAGALLRDWGKAAGHVFFDLGRQQPIIWRFPAVASGAAFVRPFERDYLLRLVRESGWREFEREISIFAGFVSHYEPVPELHSPARPSPPSPPPGWLPPIRRHFRF